MSVRSIHFATVGLLALAATAAAQQNPPPAPPATPTPTPPPAAKPQDAPPAAAPQADPEARHTTKVELGDAKLTLDHGAPPWNEQRLADMSQAVPVGAWWRMGSGAITTLEIAGAPVLFGDQIVQPGRYGLNLLHVADNAWQYVLFVPKTWEGALGMVPADTVVGQVATTFVSDAKESASVLAVDLTTSDKACAQCALAWGPMRVSASIAAVTIRTAKVEINGVDATSSWFDHPVPASADLGKPMLAGSITMTIGDENCSMNVYVMQKEGKLVVLFRNQERESWEREHAAAETKLKGFDQAKQQYGEALVESRFGSDIGAAKRALAKTELMLEDSTNRPDNLEFSETATDAPVGTLSTTILRTRGGVHLEVTFGGKRAVVRMEDEKFSLKESG